MSPRTARVRFTVTFEYDAWLEHYPEPNAGESLVEMIRRIDVDGPDADLAAWVSEVEQMTVVSAELIELKEVVDEG